MARRSKAREVCLQMLFQADVNPDIDAQTVQGMIDKQLSNEALSLFSWQLFSGVMEIRSMLDERIQDVAENWSLSRMAPTDRNVLRLGAFELLHTENVVKAGNSEGACHQAGQIGVDNNQHTPRDNRLVRVYVARKRRNFSHDTSLSIPT